MTALPNTKDFKRAELLELQAQIQRQLEEEKAENIKLARLERDEKLDAICKEWGLTREELCADLSPKASRKAGTKFSPKYWNPNNHAETWTEIGSPPKWLRALAGQKDNIHWSHQEAVTWLKGKAEYAYTAKPAAPVVQVAEGETDADEDEAA